MAGSEREIKLRYIITDDGTVEVLDKIGNKLGVLDRQAVASGASIASGFKAASVGVAAFTAALAAASAGAKITLDQLKRTSELDQLARSIGLSVTELSSYSLAARVAHTDIASLGAGLGTFNRQLVESSSGVGRTAGLLNALGVTAKQTQPALEQLADAMLRLPEGPEKFAAFQRFFGPQAAEFQQIMSRGSAGLKEYRAEAERLGVVIGEDFAEQAREANENLAKLGTGFEGLKNQIAITFAPAVTRVLEDLAGGIASIGPAFEQARQFMRDFFAEFDQRLLNGAGSTPFGQTIIRRLDDTLFGGLLPDAQTNFSNVTAGGSSNAGIDPALAARVRSELSSRGPKNTAEETAARRAQQEAERSALASAQARLIVEETTAEHLQAQLGALQESSKATEALARTDAERLAAITGGYQEQLQLAQQIDTAERRLLDAQIAVLQTKGAEKDITAGEKELLQAQVGQLALQKQLIGSTTGEAAKLTREYQNQTAELQASKRVVLDLGSEIRNSIRRATDGLLQSGGDFDFKNLFEGTGQALASEFIGGFIEAELAKSSFDQKITDNFTVTLPGIFSRGASSMEESFGSSLSNMAVNAQGQSESIGSAFTSMFSRVGSAATQLGHQLFGTARNISAGTGQPIVQDAFGTSFSGPGAEAIAAGNSPAAGAGGIGAAGYLAIVAAGIGAITGGLGAAAKERKRFGATDESVQNALAAGVLSGSLSAIGLGSVGDPLGKLISKGGIAGNIASDTLIAAAFSGGIPVPGFHKIQADLFEALGIFQAPTVGTQGKRELSDLLEDAGLPRQRAIETGGRSGVRVPRFEEAPTQADIARFQALGLRPGVGVSGVSLQERIAGLNPLTQGPRAGQLGRIVGGNPEVNELRFGSAFGLFTSIFGESEGATGAAINAFINNAQELGLSVEETERQIRKLADTAGVNLVSGLEEVNRLFLEGKIPVEQFKGAAAGIVQIFEDDIPAGVNVAALVTKNFAEQGGLNIANYTKELEVLVGVFGQLEGAEKDALRGAVSTLGSLSGGSTRQGFVSALLDGIGPAIKDALSELASNQIFDSREFKGLLTVVANFVNGDGSIGQIETLIGVLVDKSIPALERTAKAMEEVNNRLSITPSALTGSATSIREQANNARFGGLSRSGQERFLRGRLSSVSGTLAGLFGDATPDSQQAVDIRRLLEEQSGLGLQLADVASARFAPGSRRNANAREEGLRIAEDAANALEILADQVEDSLRGTNLADVFFGEGTLAEAQQMFNTLITAGFSAAEAAEIMTRGMNDAGIAATNLSGVIGTGRQVPGDLGSLLQQAYLEGDLRAGERQQLLTAFFAGGLPLQFIEQLASSGHLTRTLANQIRQEFIEAGNTVPYVFAPPRPPPTETNSSVVSPRVAGRRETAETTEVSVRVEVHMTSDSAVTVPASVGKAISQATIAGIKEAILNG